MGGATALAASYPLFIERYAFQVNTYRIPVPHLPPNFIGFTLAQLADLHYGFLMPLGMAQQIVHQINALPKDLVVCTGDYIHARKESTLIDTIWPTLATLQAPAGVCSILGNHDHWGSTERSLYWLEKSGQSVRHTARAIVKGAERIWIGGSGDLWEDELGIDEAFQYAPPEECKILLTHNPDSADTDFETRVDLMIAGHTHGGQVNLPFVGPPVLPVRNKAYSSGFIRTGNTRLYISRGLGWGMLPVRFNCFPEISVLTLTREETP